MWTTGLTDVQIWDLFEGHHLFNDIFDEKGKHDPFKHLSMMIALIGQPPTEFLKRSETTEQCFGSDGKHVLHNSSRGYQTVNAG